jgi:hypothetical protein
VIGNSIYGSREITLPAKLASQSAIEALGVGMGSREHASESAPYATGGSKYPGGIFDVACARPTDPPTGK